MCFYAKYSSQTSNTVVYPITFDEGAGLYTVICQTTHTLSQAELDQAWTDATSNITALNSYDKVGAKAEFQLVLDSITAVES